jgi:hypothetical protein
VASGRFGPPQAHVVTQAKDALSDAVTPQARAAFEADLLVQAETLDPWQLRTAVKRAAARVDPTGSGDLERAEREARQHRELVMNPRAGMYILPGPNQPNHHRTHPTHPTHREKRGGGLARGLEASSRGHPLLTCCG